MAQGMTELLRTYVTFYILQIKRLQRALQGAYVGGGGVIHLELLFGTGESGGEQHCLPAIKVQRRFYRCKHNRSTQSTPTEMD